LGTRSRASGGRYLVIAACGQRAYGGAVVNNPGVVGGGPPETLALALAEAYRQDDRNAISFLTIQIDSKFRELLESGALEKVVGLVQVVAPAGWIERLPRALDT
jgi:hypothetical protein